MGGIGGMGDKPRGDFPAKKPLEKFDAQTGRDAAEVLGDFLADQPEGPDSQFTEDEFVNWFIPETAEEEQELFVEFGKSWSPQDKTIDVAHVSDDTKREITLATLRQQSLLALQRSLQDGYLLEENGKYRLTSVAKERYKTTS